MSLALRRQLLTNIEHHTGHTTSPCLCFLSGEKLTAHQGKVGASKQLRIGTDYALWGKIMQTQGAGALGTWGRPRSPAALSVWTTTPPARQCPHCVISKNMKKAPCHHPWQHVPVTDSLLQQDSYVRPPLSSCVL